VQSSEIVTGRKVGVVLHSGDEVIASIAEACAAHGIRQAYIPVFLGAFRAVRFIASHSPIPNQEAPLKDSIVVSYVEGIGSGSVSWDERSGTHTVHLHAAVGVKDSVARGHVGHVLAATTHYVAEIVIEEVLSPLMARVADPQAFGLENLVLQPESPEESPERAE
jgi:predicted DNA-binding protein with PD1-like motif